MEAVREKHQGLITGLTKLYNLLISMHYLYPGDVIYPPHTESIVDVERLKRLGFNDEVINVTKVLPALRHGVVWGSDETEIGPSSHAVNYFKHGHDAIAPHVDDDMMDGLRNCDFMGDDGLPSWLLRISQESYTVSGGVNLVYNPKDQTLREWFSNTPWVDSPARPAALVLEEWYTNINSLEWVPRYSAPKRYPSSRTVVQHPAIRNRLCSGPAGVDEALRLAESWDEGARNCLKLSMWEWRGMQYLYSLCGWGCDGQFDGDEFERQRALLEETYHDAILKGTVKQFWDRWAMENGVFL